MKSNSNLIKVLVIISFTFGLSAMIFEWRFDQKIALILQQVFSGHREFVVAVCLSIFTGAVVSLLAAYLAYRSARDAIVTEYYYIYIDMLFSINNVCFVFRNHYQEVSTLELAEKLIRPIEHLHDLLLKAKATNITYHSFGFKSFLSKRIKLLNKRQAAFEHIVDELFQPVKMIITDYFRATNRADNKEDLDDLEFQYELIAIFTADENMALKATRDLYDAVCIYTGKHKEEPTNDQQ